MIQDQDSDIIIRYDSYTFNNIYFKKKEKKNLLLIIKENHLIYIKSLYDDFLTHKINLTRRFILYKSLINKYLNAILPYQINCVCQDIMKFIGLSLTDIYSSVPKKKLYYNFPLVSYKKIR